MADIYAANDNIGKEKLPETSTGLAGNYMAIIGRTYKSTFKSGSGGIVTEFFLVNRTSDDGSIVHKVMDLGPSGASFIVNKDGSIRIDGVMMRHNCPDPSPTTGERGKNFMIQIRKRFAKAFAAFDEATGQVDWTKIQQAAGTLASFTLKEKDEYLNIDTKTIQINPQQKISNENLLKLYADFAAQIEKNKAARGAQSAPLSAPPPPPVDPDPIPF